MTVRDIAAAAGVHFTTVSLALRNSPRLNAETRRRLQLKAEQMGYTPDPMVSALIAYRSELRTPRFQAVLAWINNWPRREDLLRIPSFQGYYQGACERARQLGYMIEEIWLHDSGTTPDKLPRVLRAQGIQGLLMAPQPTSRMWPGIEFEPFSAVSFGYSMQPAVLNVVTNHHYHTMAMMFSRLVELGYERIGLFMPEDWDAKVENHWTAGWLIASQKYAGKVVALPAYVDPPEDYPRLRKWFNKHRPDVVIGRVEEIAAVEALGFSVPGDVGFAGLDLHTDEVRYSGTYQNSVLIGQKAVDILIGMIHRDERGVPATPVRTLVESTWVPGTTLRAQRATPTAAS